MNWDPTYSERVDVSMCGNFGFMNIILMSYLKPFLKLVKTKEDCPKANPNPETKSNPGADCNPGLCLC